MVAEPALEQSAEDAERRVEPKLIAHASSIVHWREVMFVLKVRDIPLAHEVTKVGVGAPRVDDAGVARTQTEAPSGPGDCFAGAKEARGGPRQCLFSGLARGF